LPLFGREVLKLEEETLLARAFAYGQGERITFD
jgi:hypothetical protein